MRLIAAAHRCRERESNVIITTAGKTAMPEPSVFMGAPVDTNRDHSCAGNDSLGSAHRVCHCFAFRPVITVGTFHLPRHLFPATERNVRGAENECPRMRARNINARLSAGTPGPRVSGNSMGSSSFPGLLRREIRRYLITRRLAVRQYETKPLCLRPRTGQEPRKRSFAEPHTCV